MQSYMSKSNGYDPFCLVCLRAVSSNIITWFVLNFLTISPIRVTAKEKSASSQHVYQTDGYSAARFSPSCDHNNKIFVFSSLFTLSS